MPNCLCATSMTSFMQDPRTLSFRMRIACKSRRQSNCGVCAIDLHACIDACMCVRPLCKMKAVQMKIKEHMTFAKYEAPLPKENQSRFSFKVMRSA